MRIFALDFDGVLCDSALETGLSGWRGGREIWPEWDDSPPEACLDQFVRLRPILETGYQAILLMRTIWMDTPAEEIRENFPILCAELMDQTGLSPDLLVRIFGKARDRWLRDSPDDWLARNSFYPGTLNALRRALKIHQVFIITTKQERFVHALLSDRGIELPSSALFGLDTGKSKEQILLELHGRENFTDIPICFIEDRLDTLRRIAESESLSGVRLRLADWGYVTERDRTIAEGLPEIEILSRGEFVSTLSERG